MHAAWWSLQFKPKHVAEHLKKYIKIHIAVFGDWLFIYLWIDNCIITFITILFHLLLLSLWDSGIFSGQGCEKAEFWLGENVGPTSKPKLGRPGYLFFSATSLKISPVWVALYVFIAFTGARELPHQDEYPFDKVEVQ